MASFADLPSELALEIAEYLEHRDKIHLSATSPKFRTLLASQIFETIRFTNDEVVAKSALAAAERYGDYTIHLEFEGVSEPNEAVTTPVLPLAAAQLLQGQHFRNLHTMKICFRFDFWEGDWLDPPSVRGNHRIDMFKEVETTENVEAQERNKKWRALMNETWLVLSSTKHIKRLTVEGLIPKWTSAFRTEAFHQFLGRLESATISVLNLDAYSSLIENAQGYAEFVESLDLIFFQHMRALKHLSLCASQDEGSSLYVALSLKPGDLPALESLKLENWFIAPELVLFLEGCAKTLKALELVDCASGNEGFDHDYYITWSQFFDQVYKTGPCLSKFVVDWNFPLISGKEMRNESYKNAEAAQEVHRMLKAHSRLRLFNYSYAGRFFEFRWSVEKTTVDKFNEGQDQLAFDRLVALVQQNATREQTT
ncbi:hypothetical protein BX600DRAFT_428677 [Xylariales sp. PMI_506]|nr:hypothetical protein BX600DRAFT_428677 [Xylariales sp. PMI_506]